MSSSPAARKPLPARPAIPGPALRFFFRRRVTAAVLDPGLERRAGIIDLEQTQVRPHRGTQCRGIRRCQLPPARGCPLGGLELAAVERHAGGTLRQLGVGQALCGNGVVGSRAATVIALQRDLRRHDQCVGVLGVPLAAGEDASAGSTARTGAAPANSCTTATVRWRDGMAVRLWLKMKASIRQKLEKAEQRFEGAGSPCCLTLKTIGIQQQFRDLSVEYARLQRLSLQRLPTIGAWSRN